VGWNKGKPWTGIKGGHGKKPGLGKGEAWGLGQGEAINCGLVVDLE
jgi:hypothetical protein